MALFEVPGWTVHTPPVPGPSATANSRKRKRPDPERDEGARLQSAAVNVEKLMAKLEAGGSGGDVGERAKKSKKARGKEKRKESVEAGGADARQEKSGGPRAKEFRNLAGQGSKQGKRQGDKQGKRLETEKRTPAKTVSVASSIPAKSPERSTKKQKRKGQSTEGKVAIEHDGDEVAEKPVFPQQKKKKGQDAAGEGGLTALQARMKQSLDGARFRWINETLYKSDSAHAHDMIRENPSVFAEYHTGFRHQVQSWPVNPVSHYVSALSSYPPKTVIADLGCGDAALARALIPEGLTVLSYDLVSDDAFVVEADVCSRIPLPGRESEEDDEEAAQVVDVVVCALSLMSTNWVGCVREAWRILKTGGELKIAEVASRFTEVEEFTSLVSSVGFKLRSKDDSNSHFTLFDFTKVPRKPKSDKEWAKLMERGEVLKPCEYKRR